MMGCTALSIVRRPHWKAPPAKLHHAATGVDREDDPAPGIRIPDKQPRHIQLRIMRTDTFENILNSCIAIRRPHQSRLAQGKAVRRAIRKAGAKLIFLPKYSPDLNPIEQVFAKLLSVGASWVWT